MMLSLCLSLAFSRRFKNFNIDNRDIEDCRDAHRELQERIDAIL